MSVGSLIQSSWGIQVKIYENVNNNTTVIGAVDRVEEKSEEVLMWTRRTFFTEISKPYGPARPEQSAGAERREKAELVLEGAAFAS